MMLNWFIVVLSVAIASLLGYWAQDRESPTVILEEFVETPHVPPGGILRVAYRVHRQKLCRVNLEQIVFDAARTRWVVPERIYSVAPGGVGEEQFAVPVEVDPRAAEGMARYRAIRLYYCNPLQRALAWPVVVVSPDVVFQIAGPPVAPITVPPELRGPRLIPAWPPENPTQTQDLK